MTKLRGTAKKALISLLILFSPGYMAFSQDAEDDVGDSPSAKSEKSIFSFEGPVIKSPEEKRWFFNLSGFYIRKLGNTDNLNANLQTDISYNTNLSELEIAYKTFYGKTAGVVNENKGTGVAKYDRYVLPRMEFFAFTQSEYNDVAKLIYRNNSGLGAKFIFFKNYFWRMDVSAAPVYQYEHYLGLEVTNTYRWSFRYRLKVTPFEDITGNIVTFYIPKMGDFEQYRLSIDMYLQVGILAKLSLKLGYSYSFNKNALPDTKRYDYTSYAQIGLTI